MATNKSKKCNYNLNLFFLTILKNRFVSVYNASGRNVISRNDIWKKKYGLPNGVSLGKS